MTIISVLLLGTAYMIFDKKTSNRKTQTVESTSSGGFEYDFDEEGRVYAKDAYETYDLSDSFANIETYSDILDKNDFLEEVEQEVGQALYKGYEIDNFRFNQFTSRVKETFFGIFFSSFNHFTDEEKEKLQKTADESEHTWNTLTTEYAIVGDHLNRLENDFGKEDSAYQAYKEAYIDSGSLQKAVESFKTELLNRKNYSLSQANTIKKIIRK